ncbi:MAG: sulfite exporter TauE/SafE family protein, partial [Candidatus Sericytochromatia bacterium]
ALMLMPVNAEDGSDELPADFRPGVAAAIAGGVGVISGLLGAGGAFLMVPLMRTVLKLPLRLIIGTSLGIVLASAVSGTIAKALTGQIPWVPAGSLVLGALLGAPLGAKVSHRVPTPLLRWGLAAAIGLTALKMIWQLVS